MSGAVWAVLLAAGSSRRLTGDCTAPVPKQFLRVGGRRAVDRVVATAAQVADGVVLVLPAGTAWDGPPVDVVVPGGATRAGSVRAGLAAVLAGADAAQCALPVTEVVDRVHAGRVVEVLPKADQLLAQSPAAFRADVLRAAHAGGAEAVEDVALVLPTGAQVVCVPGDPLNLHVTTAREHAMADVLAALLDVVPDPTLQELSA